MSLINKIKIEPRVPLEKFSPHLIKKFLMSLGRTRGRISTKKEAEFLFSIFNNTFPFVVDPMLRDQEKFVASCSTLKTDISIYDESSLKRYFDHVLCSDCFTNSKTIDKEISEVEFYETIFRLLIGSKNIIVLDHMFFGVNRHYREKNYKVVENIRTKFPHANILIITKLHRHSFGSSFECKIKNIQSIQKYLENLDERIYVSIFFHGRKIHGRMIIGDFGSIVLDNSIYFDNEKPQVWSLLSKRESDKILKDLEERKKSEYSFGKVTFYRTEYSNLNGQICDSNLCNSIEKFLRYIANC